MKTLDPTTAGDPQEHADMEAVLRHVFEGQPLDPEVSQRAHEQAAKITEEIRRVHGVIDDATFQSLLDDDEA